MYVCNADSFLSFQLYKAEGTFLPQPQQMMLFCRSFFFLFLAFLLLDKNLNCKPLNLLLFKLFIVFSILFFPCLYLLNDDHTQQVVSLIHFVD